MAAKHPTIIDDYQKIQAAVKDYANNITLPWMTKYELDQLIGLRVMHISRGALPLVDVGTDYKIVGNMDLRAVALKELEQGKLPYIIKRPLPNGKSEYWPVEKLSLEAVKYMMR
jgi:DNA-directed RNA polymerase I, II, and III subunit RPABC2